MALKRGEEVLDSLGLAREWPLAENMRERERFRMRLVEGRPPPPLLVDLRAQGLAPLHLLEAFGVCPFYKCP